MKGIIYQLKNIRRDKLCIMTFLLPVIAGIAVNLLSGVSFQTMNETSFGIIQNDLSSESAAWLQTCGHVLQYETVGDLQQAVRDPSTQMIGVVKAGNGIRTFLSGDELEVNRIIADTLPQFYENRKEKNQYSTTIIPVPHETDGLKSLLIVITLVTAMFMGCTYNAMNIISEKEDGIAWISQILPMTAKTYLIQKVFIGFTGGTLSAGLTALICMKVKPVHIVPLAMIILLSSFIAALTGLYIGHFSKGVMTGIVLIKVVMILFLAPPVFFYLMIPDDSILFYVSYLLPSSAAFYGLMDLATGVSTIAGEKIVILAVHCITLFLLYLPVSRLSHSSI